MSVVILKAKGSSVRVIMGSQPDNMGGGRGSIFGDPLGDPEIIKPDIRILPPTPKSYITFVALENNSSVGFVKISSNQIIEYSSDKSTWNLADTSTLINLSKDQEIYFRGILSGDNSISNYTQFKINGGVKVKGNCNYLWNHNDPSQELKVYCGLYLFRNCTGLRDASELLLPTLSLSDGCYSNMFSGCTSLITSPELPATILAPRCYDYMFNMCLMLSEVPSLPATDLTDCIYCYSHMFQSCRSIINTPELPATKLSRFCYWGMFRNCTDLQNASNLPALELVDYCYQEMFLDCSKLEVAPDLLALELVDFCYNNMFKYCSKLTYIKCLATDISASDCTGYWLEDASKTGTFVKARGVNWPRTVSGIPIGWTVIEE